MTRILVDFTETTRGNVKLVKLKNETWALHGECSRCGECCKTGGMPLKEIADKNGRCIKLDFEFQNGKKMAKCTAPYESRPAFCFLYPRDPYAKLNEGCAFKWERLE